MENCFYWRDPAHSARAGLHDLLRSTLLRIGLREVRSGVGARVYVCSIGLSLQRQLKASFQVSPLESVVLVLQKQHHVFAG